MKVGSNEIVEMSNSLAKFYKYSLNKGNNVFKVKDEIQLTKTYVNIQTIRFKNKINISYEVSEEVLELSTVKLIIQPFIENSITHGMWGDKKSINIKLTVKLEDNKIEWKIIDDGIGMSRLKAEHLLDKDGMGISSGYGIGNVDKRIKLYYGNSFGVKIYSRKCIGTTIIITTDSSKFE